MCHQELQQIDLYCMLVCINELVLSNYPSSLLATGFRNQCTFNVQSITTVRGVDLLHPRTDICLAVECELTRTIQSVQFSREFVLF